MFSFSATWEDDETNRKVEVLVNYSVQDEQITIEDITPMKVTFHDGRSVLVWTKAGASHLAAKFRAANNLQDLTAAIAADHAVSIAS